MAKGPMTGPITWGVWTRSGRSLDGVTIAGDGEEKFPEFGGGPLALSARHISDDAATPGALVSSFRKPFGREALFARPPDQIRRGLRAV